MDDRDRVHQAAAQCLADRRRQLRAVRAGQPVRHQDLGPGRAARERAHRDRSERRSPRRSGGGRRRVTVWISAAPRPVGPVRAAFLDRPRTSSPVDSRRDLHSRPASGAAEARRLCRSAHRACGRRPRVRPASGHAGSVPNRRVPSRLTGPATRATARDAGISEKQLRRRDVVRLSRDTYLPVAIARDLPARVAARPADRTAGAVVSHSTAAVLWGIAIPLRARRTLPSTSRSARGRPSGPAGPGHPSQPAVDADDVTRRRGFPVTTTDRTWRDLAMVLAPAALLAVTDQLLAMGCTILDLQDAAGPSTVGQGLGPGTSGAPGRRPTGRITDGVGAALAAPCGRVATAGPAARGPGRPVDACIGRADLAWPDRLVLVEFDGDIHRERDVFVNDLRRQNLLVAAGWVVLRFTLCRRPRPAGRGHRRDPARPRAVRSAHSPLQGAGRGECADLVGSVGELGEAGLERLLDPVGVDVHVPHRGVEVRRQLRLRLPAPRRQVPGRPAEHVRLAGPLVAAGPSGRARRRRSGRARAGSARPRP